MTTFQVVAVRGPLDESVHHVSVAVADAEGRLVAQARTPELVTFWRSAAKPFQLWPLVAGGGIARFGLDPEMLALACGSHNAEPIHRTVGQRWLDLVGLEEADLSCGGHPSLSARVAEQMVRDGIVPTELWSNCSGKHAALLALARLHGWPTAGYEAIGHPVQDEVARSFAHWSGVPVPALHWGVDGCTAAAVAMPLAATATAWARLGTTDDAAMATIRAAMHAHPEMVAGTDRLDTTVMQAWPGRVLAKIGAEGVYGASLPTLGLGVALKVEDGDLKVAGYALMAVLEALTARFDRQGAWPTDTLARWRMPTIKNTRGVATGQWALRGALTFA